MLTGFGLRFDRIDRLAAELQAHIRQYDVRIGRDRGGWVLRLPGRPPYPWQAPRLRVRLRRHPPGSNLGEAAETAALDFVLDRCGPQVFYDIGASRGYFAHIAAMRPDRVSAVHAFDLAPADIAAIRGTAQKLGLNGITAHQSGLGRAHLGEADIWVARTRMFDREPTEAEIREPWPIRAKLALTGRRDKIRPQHHRVLRDSIDAFAARHPPPPGVIKMDIDGFEAEALPGGMETFRTHRPVILLEIHRARFYRRFGVTRAEILRPLFDLGYSALFLEHRTRHRRVEVIPVGPDHPLLARERTDFLVLV
ncbi:MAG: FkbM family methyltransferase [Pseudomonadota bacterium]